MNYLQVVQDFRRIPGGSVFNQRQHYYGTVAETLLTTLTSNAQERDRAVSMVQAIQGQFVDDFVPVNSHGQVFRAASRFGMVAGVGEYAISIRALPWDAGEAFQSVQRCFHSWLAERGGNVASEELRKRSITYTFKAAH